MKLGVNMDEQGSSTRDEVRSRRRNVALDWDGIDEERKRSLKQTRGNAKRALTIAMNKAGESLLVGNSVEEVRLIQVSLDQVFENFSQTCDSYRETLESEDDQDECMAYFHETQLKYLCMKDRIALRLESIHPIQQTHSDENREDSEWRLTPKDSVSQVRSKKSLFSSRGGSRPVSPVSVHRSSFQTIDKFALFTKLCREIKAA